MKGPMKKILRFQQIRVISNCGIFNYFFVSYFSLLGIDLICIIFEYIAYVPASKLVIFL